MTVEEIIELLDTCYVELKDNYPIKYDIKEFYARKYNNGVLGTLYYSLDYLKLKHKTIKEYCIVYNITVFVPYRDANEKLMVKMKERYLMFVDMMDANNIKLLGANSNRSCLIDCNFSDKVGIDINY